MSQRHSILGVLCAVTGVVSSAPATILFVDDSAAPGGTGLSWADPLAFLQDALNDPAATTVHVAQGTYTPDRDAANPGGSGDRAATFDIPPNVAVLGGYAGVGAGVPGARDVALYLTILSGDLSNDDHPDPIASGFAGYGENSYHVVTADAASQLDGFTIRGGDAMHSPGGGFLDKSGGGLLVPSGPVSVRSCTFVGNRADDGGGVWLYSGSIALRDCAFLHNKATRGGGFGCEYDSSVDIVKSSVTGNVADLAGGGLYLGFESASRIINSRIAGNKALDGAGIYNVDNLPMVLANSIIDQNEAQQDGGGIWMMDTNTQIINCTVYGNKAVAGGGIYALSDTYDDHVSVWNSVVWNNYATPGMGPQIALENLDPSICTPDDFTVEYSVVSDGQPGIQLPASCWTLQWGSGNLTADPTLVDPDGPDGLPSTFADNDYRLVPRSPCIDAADGSVIPSDQFDLDADGDLSEPLPIDVLGNPRYHDDTGTFDIGFPPGPGMPVPDIGAIEFQWTTPPVCSADLNGDGQVGFADLLLLIRAWGPCSGCLEDIDGDGMVGLVDVVYLLQHWGICP